MTEYKYNKYRIKSFESLSWDRKNFLTVEEKSQKERGERSDSQRKIKRSTCTMWQNNEREATVRGKWKEVHVQCDKTTREESKYPNF